MRERVNFVGAPLVQIFARSNGLPLSKKSLVQTLQTTDGSFAQGGGGTRARPPALRCRCARDARDAHASEITLDD